MIVYDDGQFKIDWNEKATFNVFMDNINVDCFTVYNVTTIMQAVEIAEEHVKNDIMGEG